MNPFTKEKPYRTLNQTLRERFGKKVFKVPLNGDFTCPNRDGTKAVGGCIFCSEKGSGDFNAEKSLPLKAQFDTLKKGLLKKWPNSLTMPYFQANTNTYKDVGTLRGLYSEALSLDESVVGLAVATRCDALEEEKIDLLAEVNNRTYLQVELGLQSVHEKTADFINRAHDLRCFDDAVKRLRNHGIEVVVHIINGLPGEDAEMMLQTVEHLNNLDIQGVKIHMLHVLEDTKLAELYRRNEFSLLTREEYVDITVRQIERLRPDIVIHRLTGDAPKDRLIAPKWTLKKFVVINEIDKLLRKKNTHQGVFHQHRSH